MTYDGKLWGKDKNTLPLPKNLGFPHNVHEAVVPSVNQGWTKPATSIIYIHHCIFAIAITLHFLLRVRQVILQIISGTWKPAFSRYLQVDPYHYYKIFSILPGNDPAPDLVGIPTFPEKHYRRTPVLTAPISHRPSLLKPLQEFPRRTDSLITSSTATLPFSSRSSLPLTYSLGPEAVMVSSFSHFFQQPRFSVPYPTLSAFLLLGVIDIL